MRFLLIFSKRLFGNPASWVAQQDFLDFSVWVFRRNNKRERREPCVGGWRSDGQLVDQPGNLIQAIFIERIVYELALPFRIDNACPAQNSKMLGSYGLL